MLPDNHFVPNSLLFGGYADGLHLLLLSVAALFPGPPPPQPFCLHHPDTSWNLGQTYDTQDLINPKCWICRQISHAGQCVELHNSTCHVVLLAPFLAGTIPLPGNNHNQKHQILQHPGKPLELFHASEKDIKCQSWLQLLVEQEN